MSFRVIFDFGDIEIMVMHESHQMDSDKIMNEVTEKLKKRGVALPFEDSIVTVEKAPEWSED